MEMNIVAMIALILLVVYALNGLRLGMVKTVFSTFTIIVAIAVAINISPYISRSWQNTAVSDKLSLKIENTLFGDEESEISKVTEQTETIQNLPLPASVKEALLENNNAEIYDAFGITAFKAYVANYLTCLILNALSFILTFLGSIIILRIIAGCLNIVSYLPVLHSLNKLGGFAFGLINGLVILWIICIAVTIFSGTQLGSYIYSQINASVFLRLIYDHNYLLTVISNLKYLIV